MIDDGLPIFFRVEYICEVDWELCTGCKSCMSQCQFGAIFYSFTLSKVYINPKKCFGCGLCRAVCQNEAIRILYQDRKIPKPRIFGKNSNDFPSVAISSILEPLGEILTTG